MNPNIKKISLCEASVLVVALVVCAIGTLGILATVSVIGARSLESESHLKGLDRRVTFRNSQALAKEVIYRNYLPEDGTLDAEQTFSAGTWATVKVGAFSKAALSFSDAARTHPTGAAPIRAFSEDVSVKLSDGSFDHVFQYQMRSYNPALAGDLLSIHPTTETTTESTRILGDLKVKGRAVFWGADYYQGANSTVRSEEVIVPFINPPKLVLENPDGNTIKPSNYVGFSQTMGKVGSGNSFGGELDIVDNPVTGVNSYFERLSTLGGEIEADGGV